MPSVIPFPSTKILFYADYSATHLLSVPTGGTNLRKTTTEFGLSILKELLEASLIPSVTVDLVNRFWELNEFGDIPENTTRKHPPTLLTPDLLKQYGQIWFFGQHLGNFNDSEMVTSSGGVRTAPDQNGYPESLLSSDELTALRNWMDNGGGVLILGDHSNMAPDGLLHNLGYALGRTIPRAGQMRKWFGTDSGCAYVTQGGPVINTSGDDSAMGLMPKQADGVPQTIYPFIWEVVTPWTIELHWHPLFQGAPSDDDPTGIITVMADHGHEGVVTLPSGSPDFNDADWPRAANGYQPMPTIVARGVNQNNGERIDLISAYDGQQAGVGRIVAHTTWHHFVNVNLNGFRHPDGSPDETLQILSQYYLNLASYLMPRRDRAGTLGMMLQLAAGSSNMRDLVGAPLDIIGRAAFEHLGKLVTRGQIHDLINLSVEQVIPPNQDSLQLRLPSREHLLGGLIAEHRSSYEPCEGADSRQMHAQMACAARGIKRALRSRLEEYATEAENIKKLLGKISY
ncbi:hypothetical protein [Paraburkholderia diazotrophica]|uniref:Uncharacterized protein n=1 Tax=Paraburkholderia diazotrophica TaxID=667676 RepID=A0A1H6TM63_9BURK|nr:hypothetical protein [Paraburkholderia diazotrophica]SEI81163.1 hypothetical protein SAMN05192539_1004185 [Paraburkholderia diazotrophica]